MRLIDANAMDWRKWEKLADAQIIKPLKVWMERVKEELRQGDSPMGTALPWKKTQDHWRLRMCELTLWAGLNNHGKSLVLQQAMTWISQFEPVLIISLEMPPVETIKRAVKQASGVANCTDHFADAFANWTDGKIWLLDHLGEMEPNRLIAIIHYAAKELGVKHVVLDSLMMTTIDNDDLKGQANFVRRLKEFTHSLEIHIHLVAHSRKPDQSGLYRRGSRYEIKGSGDISDKADNVVIVWRNERKEAKEENDEKEIEVNGDRKRIANFDMILRVDKQRHYGPAVGDYGFFFHEASGQFCENSYRKPIPFPNEAQQFKLLEQYA